MTALSHLPLFNKEVRMTYARTVLVVPLLIALSICSAQNSQKDTGTEKPLYVELSGSAYDRGTQHGKALKSDIADILGRFKADIKTSRNRDADSLIAEFLHATDFIPAIKKWTPDLLDEVKGIADGSGQKFETIFAYQLPDEIWVYFDKLDAHHCSGIGVAKTATHPAYVAQNIDLESWRHGSQAVLHILQSATLPEQFVFTSAGLIGANGVNNSSIGVCANTLMQLNAAPDGLPVAFVIRGLLAMKSEQSALEFIKTVHHASGQNYILGIVDKVYDFEASATGVVRFIPFAGGTLVYHTNHPLANDDLKLWWAKRTKQMTPEERKYDNSSVRFASLETRVAKSDNDIGEQKIKETLRSKDSEWNPVCRSLKSGNAGFTFGSTIMTLSDHPSLQVTYGPPDKSEYVLYSFRSTSTPEDASPKPQSK
jgi:isopenicillin-N N-acyltransferase-like protein